MFFSFGSPEEAKASEDAQKEAEAGNMQLHESQSHLVHVCNPNNVLTMQVGNGYRLNLPKRLVIHTII